MMQQALSPAVVLQAAPPPADVALAAPPERELVPVQDVPLPLDRNPAAVYLAGKPSAVGRRGLQRALNRAAEILTGGITNDALAVNWGEVGYQHVSALRADLIDDEAKPATINHMLSALRGVAREAWRLGQIDAERKERITDVQNVKQSTLPAGRHVDVGEVRRLFEFCEDTPIGARDACMLALLYGCGTRRSEAVALQVTDYSAGAVTVRSGKGRKDRIVYAPAGGREAIDAWLARRGFWPGTLLAPVAKGGKIQHRAMSAAAIMQRLRFIAANAGVAPFSPHDLRRSFVGELLDAGADISSVQQLAGHADVSTTQRYDRRPEGAKRKAAELLQVPYTAPPSLLVSAKPPGRADPPPAAAPG